MTINAIQQIAQTVPPSIIYADVEKSLFEDMLIPFSININARQLTKETRY